MEIGDLKYSEILKLNRSLSESIHGPVYEVAVLSNIITSQFNEIFECTLRIDNINAKVVSGDYDNIVQDSIKYSKSNLVIIFWEAANLIDGLQYKANLIKEEEFEALISKVCAEIDFILTSLQNTSLVIFNKFSGLIFNHYSIRQNKFDNICRRLNSYLEDKKSSNFLLIEIDHIISKLSVSKSIDFRYYYSSKALYTIDFYKSYSSYLGPIVRSIKGKAKKALILDCDNTLWKGVIGEDGMDGIEMSSKTKYGVVFEEMQNIVLQLKDTGIILGLCSKNNPEDVENVLEMHPAMSIRNKDIAIKKVNWDDKVSNLRNIAKELNIGLDSMVFIDDSDFELGLVNRQLPEVTTIKVPENLYEYPQLLRENQQLFYSVTASEVDLKRTEIYKQETNRQQLKDSYEDIESYLAQLELKISIRIDPVEIVSRISQLTQKTNQFNLTTRRYTETDILNFIHSDTHIVFAFEVQDKYGDSGITGVTILSKNLDLSSVSIDSLLMSCRVIGRNIEIAFFDFLIQHLKESGIKHLSAEYIKSFKNGQVSNFYERVGLTCLEANEEGKLYELNLDNYNKNEINYIKLYYGREN